MDAAGRRAFWATMRALAEHGHTVVFATHQLAEADAVADRVVVMADGRVAADGSAAAIKARVSGRTVSFTASADAASRTGPFDDVAGVTAVTWRGGTVTLATDDVERTLGALLSAGTPLADLEVRGASLEQAVLTLTESTLTESTLTGADR
jgi:ABC-2 type transport system ATP-binding protein